MVLEEVTPREKYPNEDVRVEQVDDGHLRVHNLLAGRVFESKRVASKVREFREKNPTLMGSLSMTCEQWNRLKAMPKNLLNSIMPPSTPQEDAFCVLPSDLFGVINPDEFYISKDRWEELTQFFNKV